MAKGQDGNKIRTITCKACGVSVTKRMPPRRKYCSLECYRSAPKAERRTGEDRTCDVCGTGFYVPRSRVKKGEGRFCSLACHNLNQGRGKTTHTCKVCGGVPVVPFPFGVRQLPDHLLFPCLPQCRP